MLQVPGNIRRAEHFLAFLKRFINYLKGRMGVQQVESETPHSFLGHLQTQVAIDGGFRAPQNSTHGALAQRLHGGVCRSLTVSRASRNLRPTMSE